MDTSYHGLRGGGYASPTDASAAYNQCANAIDAPVATSFHLAEETMDEARQLAFRVENLVDRLCGSSPASINEGKGSGATPGAVFPNLRESALNTSTTIRSAMMALNRLDRELP